MEELHGDREGRAGEGRGVCTHKNSSHLVLSLPCHAMDLGSPCLHIRYCWFLFIDAHFCSTLHLAY